jgi:glyoxylase I family protein
MLLGIDHIELIVRNVDESVDFFTTMGFGVVRRTPHHGGSAELKLPGEGQPLFEIHTVEGQEVPGVNHIAFLVEDVKKSHRELSARGIRFSETPGLSKATGRTIANFRDPDGWRLQLVDPDTVPPEA